MLHVLLTVRFSRRWLAAGVAVLAAGCGEASPAGVQPEQLLPDGPAPVLHALDCTATVATGAVSCGAPAASGARRVVIGGQNDFVRLTSSNVVSGGGIFEMSVTVQNLLPEAIGTPDGVAVHPQAVRVFFFEGPATRVGTGTVTVANADGEDIFLGATQPFFRYPQKLLQNEVSSPKTWQFAYDPGVEAFAFKVYVAAEVQPLLVINEVLANPKSQALPAGTTAVTDANGEWFEVYNAGRLPVQMQGMSIADSAGTKQRYHVINSPLMVEPGAYVVLGNTTNTSTNGGVPVDYAYGSAMAFSNTTADAIKISRSLTPGDTLALFTVDRVQYATAISARDGISRELKNPALDNANMDGSNWADALATATYGTPPAPPTRATPRAQNSTYTP